MNAHSSWMILKSILNFEMIQMDSKEIFINTYWELFDKKKPYVLHIKCTVLDGEGRIFSDQELGISLGEFSNVKTLSDAKHLVLFFTDQIAKKLRVSLGFKNVRQKIDPPADGDIEAWL